MDLELLKLSFTTLEFKLYSKKKWKEIQVTQLDDLLIHFIRKNYNIYNLKS